MFASAAPWRFYASAGLCGSELFKLIIGFLEPFFEAFLLSGKLPDFFFMASPAYQGVMEMTHVCVLLTLSEIKAVACYLNFGSL